MIDRIVPEPVQLGRLAARPWSVRPRVMFYSHDSYGLGHFRRTLALAGEISRRSDAALLAVTGSPVAHNFDAPPNFDYVKLPAISKDAAGAYASRSLPISFDDVRALREQTILGAVESFRPDLFVVDHAPAGLRGELLPALERLRAGHAPVRIVLGLRDVIDEPATVRAAWMREGVFDLLDRLYDHILVYGSRSVFDPVLEYGFPVHAAAKTTFCGYIRKPDPLLPAESIRADLGIGARPLVVVTVGGGGDGARLLETYLTMLEADDPPPWTSCIVAGPLLAAETLDLLQDRAARLAHVSLIPFSDHLMSVLNAADAVVAMGGYNTVSEIIGLGKRAVVVPRAFPRQEQLVRAQRLARLGLVSFIHPDALDVHHLAAAIRRALAAPAPAARLDFAGLSRTGDVLLGALDHVRGIGTGEEAWAHV